MKWLNHTILPNPKPSKDIPTTPLEAYDLIIVGAGPSAIGILYGIFLLHENFYPNTCPPWSIAILDRGSTSRPSNITQNHHHWGYVSHKKTFSSLPQKGLCNRILSLPVGRGPGGSSTIHAGWHVVPSDTDFYHWPNGWKTEMIQSVHHINNMLSRHGCLAKTNVLIEKGVDCLAKMKNERYERVNYHEALLMPWLQDHFYLNKCIHWYFHSQVERIIWRKELDGNNLVAHGVEYTNEQEEISTLHAKLVVVCGGAILSPALLLVSLINQKHKIPSWNLIGQGLRDHILLPNTYFNPWNCIIEPSINGVRGWKKIEIPIKSTLNITESNWFKARGMYVLFDGMAIPGILPPMIKSIFLREKSTEGKLFFSIVIIFIENILWKVISHVTYLFLMLLMTVPLLRLFLQRTIHTTGICLLDTQSIGTVTIDSNPISDDSISRLNNVIIHINPNYLSHPQDLQFLEYMYKKSHVLGRKYLSISISKFFHIIFTFVRGKLGTQKELIEKYIRELAVPFYHWAGTCRLGISSDVSSDMGVVDEKLRLIGTTNVYVCDASIIPKTSSCPTALICAAIGYREAEFLSYKLTH